LYAHADAMPTPHGLVREGARDQGPSAC
jgi:hypothetical protein